VPPGAAAVLGNITHVIVAAMFELYRRTAAVTAIAIIGSGCGAVVPSRDDAGSAMDVPLDSGRSGDAPVDSGGAMADAAPAAPPSVVTLTAGADAKQLGSGSNPITDACPSGQALIGFTGALGPFSPPLVGVLSGTCGTLGVDGTAAPEYAITAGPGTMLPVRGTGDSTPWEMPCPSNQVVVGVSVRDGSSLDNFALQCAPISLVRSGSAWVGQVGTITVTQGQGGTGGSADAATCAVGQVATGYLTEVNGDSMAAIALKCSVVTGQ
jgi:hypothetical protein